MKQSFKLLPFKDASKKANKGRTAMYEEMAEGTFPRPVKTGKRGVAWVESEIDDWIERRIAERDATHTNAESSPCVFATASSMGVEVASPAAHRRSTKPMCATSGVAK